MTTRRLTIRNDNTYKYAYVMVRLINVRGKLRCGMTATSIRNWLGAHPDVYNIFNYINLFGEDPHILVGVQERDETQVDVYLVVGMIMTMDTVFEYSTVVPFEIDAYLARSNMTLGVTNRHCMYITINIGDNMADSFATWCTQIVKDCVDWAESGLNPV